MDVFFSVDVETTGTNPFEPRHQLATVGAVAVSSDGIICGNWYERLVYDTSAWDANTRSWWLEQNQLAKDEMFSTLKRMTPNFAAGEFEGWVRETANGNPAYF